ncbi:peptidoglycan-binding domain-containing protein [Thioalkalivibrio sp. XN8]|uniref:peptidoglycan-binding protein n=1 Tax=Thioalkalivibrio sp. XN8 TaxID=2712863 RepID=UPI0013EA8DA7|nr:peptidoglycan-binding protein [Thioalkalivibrio sp. XN8]
MAEIRWCLREDIRLEAIRPEVNSLAIQTKFNLSVEDYNRRCGSFQYRRGALSAAKRDVEPLRSAIVAEALRELSPSPGLTAQPAAQRSQLTLAIQNALSELGYNPGVADGIYGQRTRSAIEAFQRSYGISVDGRETPDLLRQLEQAINQRARSGASKETIQALGQRLVFSNPNGYCTLGGTPREEELLSLTKRSLGKDVRLLHAAVQCTELDEYKNGRRDTLDHWLQIQLLGPGGDFQRFEVGREAFLAGISSANPRISPQELNKRLQAAFDTYRVELSQPEVNPIGRDGNAFYFSMRMNMSVEDTTRTITGLSGMTLLNSLPIAINVYEGTGSTRSRENLQPVLQELLTSLLTQN